MTDEKKLSKEKIFKEFVPRSRVQLDIVEHLRGHLADSVGKLPKKIISYQKVIKENGEYFLLSDVAEDIMPLAEYLAKNKVDLKFLLEEFKLILETIDEFDDFSEFKSIFPEGINAANFWIDKNKKVYLMPQAFLEIRESYSSIDFDIPAAEYFKPPEIISGENWSKSAFLFNFAAVFYYFLSAKTIFTDADNAKVLNKIQSEKILELKYLTADLPESLNTLIMKMLNKNKNERGDFEQALEEISRILEKKDSDLNFAVFSKTKDMSKKNYVKRKRKKENIKLYFRQNWKLMLFFLLLFGGLFFGVFSDTPSVITEDTESEQVVGYFYEGVSTKKMGLIEETAAFDLGEMERIITESHVVEKMRTAFEKNDSASEAEQIYSLEDMKIERLSKNEDNSTYKVNYIFKFTDREGSYTYNAEDKLNLEKRDGIWEITSIEGSFAQMIEGNYPWRE